MKKFRTAEYTISSEKGRKDGLKFACVTDLHGLEFGRKNAELEKAIDRLTPDAVLIAGDMIVRKKKKTMKTALDFLVRIAGKYPVFYAPGNHEYPILMEPEVQKAYRLYKEEILNNGIFLLHNEKKEFLINGIRCVFHGLELPVEYYHKPFSPKLSPETLQDLLGTPVEGAYNILLAHNPKYGETYLKWGADLILSGHYHGGILRFDKRHGMISPQYHLFPSYCCGDFVQKKSHMIVSAGLGEHTIPIRIHNPRELISIKIEPENEKG